MDVSFILLGSEGPCLGGMGMNSLTPAGGHWLCYTLPSSFAPVHIECCFGASAVNRSCG
jgi:hypothetical protein